MTREYTEVSTYIHHADTAGLVQAITDLFAREGMVRKERLTRRLHRAPALQNNRWAVHVLAGQNGWHLLRATPWSLWSERASGAADNRLIELAQRLSSAGFLIVVMDNYPDAYGEVLIEVDGKGRSVSTGKWAEEISAESSEAGAALFSERRLESARIAPRSQLLAKLWQESQALQKQGFSQEYEDCRGDSDNEVFCRYLMRHLLGRSSWDLADPRDWPAEASYTLYFEWPAGDRPEPAEPEARPEPDVRYADGALVLEGDAVLLEGVISGRVHGFLDSCGRVAMVLVDVGEPGKRGIQVDDVAEHLQLVERNTTDHQAAAVSFLTERAATGDVAAMYAYGMRHIKGVGVNADPRTAYEWLTRAADQGHAEAQFLVGVMSKDEVKAFRYLRLAAEQGIEYAQFELGVAYQNGKGVTADGREAMAWYERAARHGNLAAQYNLGHLSIYSLKHTTSASADAEWFRREAESGDAPAQWVMGLCAEYGMGGVSRSLAEAARYYQMGADQGFGPAICNLADKYEHGKGVAQDLGKARQLYLQAAAKRVTAAYFSLGNMYKEGRGVPQDRTEAAKWLKKAADDGWEAAAAALNQLSDND